MILLSLSNTTLLHVCAFFPLEAALSCLTTSTRSNQGSNLPLFLTESSVFVSSWFVALDDLTEQDFDFGLPRLHWSWTDDWRDSCCSTPFIVFGFNSTDTLWCSRSLSARKHYGRKQGVTRLRKIWSLTVESEWLYVYTPEKVRLFFPTGTHSTEPQKAMIEQKWNCFGY